MAKAKPKTVRKTKQTCFPFDLGKHNKSQSITSNLLASSMD